MTTYAVAREVPEANPWREWKPSKIGEAPPDWQDGWEWEFLSHEGLWTKLPFGRSGWSINYTYRYRPRAIAEPAQAECDHPNAEDYRNRAERAEAEAAELALRVRKLEALVCDALLEGDV